MHETLDLFEGLGGIDVYGLERVVEHLAKQGGDAILLLADAHGGLGGEEVFHCRVPLVAQVVEVGGKLVGVVALRVGADDDAEIAGLDALHQRLEALALLAAPDFLGNGDFVAERHQNEVASGEGYLCGDARPLGGDRLLGHLHHQLLTGGDHIADLAVFGDFVEVLHAADAALAGSDGLADERVDSACVDTQVQIVEERLLVVAHVHKRGVEPRHYFLHLAQINVADRELHRGFLPVDLHQLLVFHQRDLHLILVGGHH